MEMKKIIAAVLALWLGLCPAPAYAGIGDAFDLAGAAIESVFQEDVDKVADDIIQTMEKDAAQKKILQEHIQKTEEYELKVRNAVATFTVLKQIPLIGGIVSRFYLYVVVTYCEHCVADDSHEIIVKFEGLREDLWDSAGDLLDLLADVDYDSELSLMNAGQQVKRAESLRDAILRIKRAAAGEGTTAAANQSGEKANSPTPKNAAVEKYRSLASQCGIQADVAAISRETGDGSGICLLRATGQGDRYLIYNAADGMKAIVGGNTSVNQMKEQRDGQYQVKFWLDIYDAPRSHDSEAGVWKGAMHRMPILVKYEVKNGGIIPGMITTANGTEDTTHCTEVLYETRNVNTINLLLTEIRSLR